MKWDLDLCYKNEGFQVNSIWFQVVLGYWLLNFY